MKERNEVNNQITVANAMNAAKCFVLQLKLNFKRSSISILIELIGT